MGLRYDSAQKCVGMIQVHISSPDHELIVATKSRVGGVSVWGDKWRPCTNTLRSLLGSRQGMHWLGVQF